MIVPSLLLMTQLALFYPRRHTPVWRWDPPWWLTFVVTSMLAAILVRPLVRVEF